MALNVLVIGSGAREHALAWKISSSPLLGNLYCLPGNPGTAAIAHNISAKATDFEAVAKVVEAHSIDLVVVGPENPLVAGITDFLKEKCPSVGVIGPTAKGAMLEGSKDFAKDFMVRHGIPTAAYRTFTDATKQEAFDFLDTLQAPYVLKADGLAAGKGVLIEDSLDKAKAELVEMFSGKFASAGTKVVIEQYLSGIELSVFVLTDGKDYMILPSAKDYKRIHDNDEGLNTGGMGSVSPVIFADKEFMDKVESRIIRPTVKGLSADGIDYCGFIFIGLMNCGGDPYVIEYNARMGDPETESVMARIDSDLLSHLHAASKGCLAGEKIEISENTAVTLVLVSGGYPESYRSGFKISGAQSVSDAIVFHAGTALKDGELVTAGGRVIAVTACADSLPDARDKVYREAANISFEGKFNRSDIANDLITYAK